MQTFSKGFLAVEIYANFLETSQFFSMVFGKNFFRECPPCMILSMNYPTLPKFLAEQIYANDHYSRKLSNFFPGFWLENIFAIDRLELRSRRSRKLSKFFSECAVFSMQPIRKHDFYDIGPGRGI